jgi:hypothetical protein
MEIDPVSHVVRVKEQMTRFDAGRVRSGCDG